MSVQPTRRTPAWLIVMLIGLGFCVLASCFVCPAILLPVFVQAREAARQTQCLSNLRQLLLAQQMYANDYGNRFPQASRWGDLTRPYVHDPDTYRCPSVRYGQGYGYAMNVRLSRQKMATVANPAQTPLVYDSSNLAWNAHDPVTSLPSPPRHIKEVNNIGFADGHSKSVRSP